MEEPLEVEVIAHVLGSMDHCQHCQVFIDGVGVGNQIHQTDRACGGNNASPESYRGKLVIKITDAQTPQALWKALRHGIRKYPTFIIAGHKFHGFDEEKVANLIDENLLHIV